MPASVPFFRLFHLRRAWLDLFYLMVDVIRGLIVCFSVGFGDILP